MTHTVATPDLMPVLSRGKHRNPRKGACFMEMGGNLFTRKVSCSFLFPRPRLDLK